MLQNTFMLSPPLVFCSSQNCYTKSGLNYPNFILDKSVPEDKKGKLGYGDVYTWTAICAESKLVPSWLVGRRDFEHAKVFIGDLAARLKNRIQLTTDGHKAYLNAVEDSFGCEFDYAQLIKLYGGSDRETEIKYSPADCTGTIKEKIQGNPDLAHLPQLELKIQ